MNNTGTRARQSASPKQGACAEESQDFRKLVVDGPLAIIVYPPDFNSFVGEGNR